MQDFILDYWPFVPYLGMLFLLSVMSVRERPLESFNKD